MSVVVERDPRTPPRPPFEGDDRPVCRMCGIEPGGRRRWHPECAKIRDLVWQGRALAHMVATHGRICWGCGARGHHLFLELEHIRPLWSLTPEERLEHRWWLPYNLQLLCRPCHRAKTAREARERFDIGRAREFEQLADERGLVELGIVPDRRRVIRRAS